MQLVIPLAVIMLMTIALTYLVTAMGVHLHSDILPEKMSLVHNKTIQN